LPRRPHPGRGLHPRVAAGRDRRRLTTARRRASVLEVCRQLLLLVLELLHARGLAVERDLEILRRLLGLPLLLLGLLLRRLRVVERALQPLVRRREVLVALRDLGLRDVERRLGLRLRRLGRLARLLGRRARRVGLRLRRLGRLDLIELLLDDVAL